MIKHKFPYDVVLPKVEVIGLATTAIGFSLKWALQLGGDILLLTGLGVLVLAYWLQAFAPAKVYSEKIPDYLNSTKVSTSTPTVIDDNLFLADVAYKVSCIGASVIFLGVLFKLLSWSGGTIYLFIGIGSVGLATVLAASVGRFFRKLF